MPARSDRRHVTFGCGRLALKAMSIADMSQAASLMTVPLGDSIAESPRSGKMLQLSSGYC